MNIDYCISNLNNDKLLGKGFQNKCYDFGDTVLLESRYLGHKELDSCLDEIGQIKSILDSINVNSYKVLDYKVVNDKLYILESKVKGVPIQDTNVSISSSIFINRLNELNNIEILRQFISDYIVLCDNGLSVDAGTPGNFLFDGEKINFIDLGISSEPFDKRFICFYILYNIMHTYCDINDIDEVSLISSYVNGIYEKMCIVFNELGYGSEMYTLTPNGSISEYIDKKINNFSRDVRTKSI